MTAEPKIDYSHKATNPEPEDGSVIVVRIGEFHQEDVEFRVIWRDDAEAASRARLYDAHPGDRWFDSGTEDGMGWVEHLRYATAYAPLAVDPMTRVVRSSTTEGDITDDR